MESRKQITKLKIIPDIITISRIPFSLLLFFLQPSSYLFAVFYILCGISDALDGFIARKLRTESKHGEFLDSTADLFFAAAYAVKILPFLHIPYWVWIWTAVIAVIKLAGIFISSKKAHVLSIGHSFGNKLTGIMLFLLPLSVHIADVKYAAALVCTVAAITTIKEIFIICKKEL